MSEMQKGFDVSHHQKRGKINKVNYEAAVREGYTWMVARASYGVRADPTYVEHIQRARDAGLQVGGYLFFRQNQGVEEQLEAFYSQLDAGGIAIGDVAPTLDLEDNKRYDGDVSPQAYNEKGEMILQALRATYGGAIAYLSPGFFETLGHPTWLKSYPWWIAHYTKKAQPWCPWVDWAIWQHSYKGDPNILPGEDLDLNRSRILPKVLRVGQALEETPKTYVTEDPEIIIPPSPSSGFDQEIKLVGEWETTSTMFCSDGTAITTVMRKKQP